MRRPKFSLRGSDRNVHDKNLNQTRLESPELDGNMISSDVFFRLKYCRLEKHETSGQYLCTLCLLLTRFYFYYSIDHLI